MNYSKLNVLCLVFCLVLPFGIINSQTTTKMAGKDSQRPNIILVMADDIGFECIGAYGSATYKTPNLDKMAANGVRFSNMFAQPLCTPSRVKIMTGKHNFRNYTSFGYLSPKEKTFGNFLKESGYATMIAGKWQLNGFYGDKEPGWDDLDRPHTFGFEDYCLWQVTKPKKLGERYADPLIVVNGEELPRDPDLYGPDVFSDYITDYIDERKGDDQPYFIYYPMVLVHDPFVPTPDSEEWKDPSRRYENDTRYYKDMVTYMDKIVGKIMDKLEATGQAENTLILFTGDNGTNEDIVSELVDGSTVNGRKGYLVDWGTRVPFIAYWKGKSLKGSVNDDLLDFSDVLPTLTMASHTDISGQETLDGTSFYSKIIGEPDYEKPYVYMYYKPEWAKWKTAAGVFARDERYKLYGDGRFYDLDNDVEEEHDIPSNSLSAKVLKIRKRLQNVLDQRPVINH